MGGGKTPPFLLKCFTKEADMRAKGKTKWTVLVNYKQTKMGTFDEAAHLMSRYKVLPKVLRPRKLQIIAIRCI